MNVKRAIKIALCLCAAVGAVDNAAVGRHATVSLRKILGRDSLHLSGIIAEDPTRTREVTARVDGRVEILFAAYRERWIRKGEPLLTLYSSDLATAQSDYLLLLGGAEGPLRSARERLRAMGFSENGIRRLETDRQATAMLSVVSPISGYALEFASGISSTPAGQPPSDMGMEGMGSKNSVSKAASSIGVGTLRTGMHVTKGQSLFRLNDLRKVWALLSVAAGETARLRVGLPARIRVQGAGEFSGHIDFVDPSIPQNTRSVQAKVMLDNPEGRMSIGAMVQAVVWLKPDSVWILPRSAVVDLGEKKIVWNRLPQDSNRFQPRTVKVGRIFGNDMEIVSGLSVQDVVAENGSYLYDSENFVRPVSAPVKQEALAMNHNKHQTHESHTNHEEHFGHSPTLVLTEAQEILAGIHTQKSVLKNIAQEIILTATIRQNEENRLQISSHVSGRMVKSFAAIPGQRIQKGQPLYSLYSEEMAGATREYQLMRESGEAIAQQKLRLYGMTSEQIRKLNRHRVDSVFTFLAPHGGIVENLLIREGRMVNVGDPLFEILDLDTVWLEAFAFPEDLSFLTQGKKVEIRFDAYPDAKAQGILFHLPASRPEGSAAKIHVRVKNSELRFRPGMAAKIVVRREERIALTIEKSALIPGQTNQVWIRTKPHVYSQRMVVLGVGEGTSIEVVEGVMPGEDVVISGAFLLQSENTIRHGSNSMQGMKH